MSGFVHGARQMLTERDNLTVDLFRVLPLIAVLAGIALQVVAVVWPEHKFDIQAYGLGIGTLLGAAGVAVGVRSYGEASAAPGVSVTSTSVSTTTATEKGPPA